MDGEEIMVWLDELRRVRRYLNKRMETHRKAVERLGLFATLQMKRVEIYGTAVFTKGNDYRKIMAEEEEGYRKDAAAPVKRYEEIMASLAPHIIGLPTEEAAVVMLYYGLGKSWTETAAAMKVRRTGTAKEILEKALTRWGVPAYQTGGETRKQVSGLARTPDQGAA